MVAHHQFAGQENRNTEHELDGATAVTPPTWDAVPFEHRLITKKELAAYLGITERTVEAWMRLRYVPYIKIGRTVRFRVAMVLRYVDDKYLVPAGEPRRRKKTGNASFGN
jgi:excisionase family DNA binding protein